MAQYARLDNANFRLLKDNLPGPFTFILPALSKLPKAFKGRKAVGVRIPDNRIAMALVEALGNPIMTSSVPIDDDMDYTIEPELIAERYDADVEMVIDGGEGGIELAKEVVALAESGKANFKPIYELDIPLKAKIETIAKEIYGADGVNYTKEADKALKEFEALGYGNLPVCMAKTQYSFSDDQTLLGRPSGFTITIKNCRIAAGAGFIVVLTGDIMTMPGLPKVPAAEKIDVSDEGVISGLF